MCKDEEGVERGSQGLFECLAKTAAGFCLVSTRCVNQRLLGFHIYSFSWDFVFSSYDFFIIIIVVVFESVGQRFRLWDGSSRQLFPTNNKRGSTQTGITENIYTSASHFVALYKGVQPKIISKKIYNKQPKVCFLHAFCLMSCKKKMQKRPALNRPNPPRELTIIEHLPSKSAKHSLAPKFAEYQIGGTELVQIFLFNIHRKRSDHWGGRIQREIAQKLFADVQNTFGDFN